MLMWIFNENIKAQVLKDKVNQNVIKTHHEILMYIILLLSASIKAQYVTCGSVIKLLNVDYKTRLHSHDVKYGTGSGQQVRM